MLRNTHEGFTDAHIRIFWPELYVAITELECFEDFFPENVLLAIRELAELGVTGYNKIDPYKKLMALSWLIEAVYDLSVFRTHLQSLVEKQAEKSRNKSK
jgi:hypothetical protein